MHFAVQTSVVWTRILFRNWSIYGPAKIITYEAIPRKEQENIREPMLTSKYLSSYRQSRHLTGTQRLIGKKLDSTK